MDDDSRALVLIVDDQQELCELMRDVLEGANYRVLVAYDGAAGWQLAKEELPDLVVIDVEMPEMDGFHLCRQIRAYERLKDVPIIFATKRTQMDDKARAFGLGADDYLAKPFEALELKLRVDARLRGRARRFRPERRGLRVDRQERMAYVPGRPVPVTLTANECAVLVYLLPPPSQPVSAKALMSRALNQPVDTRQSTSSMRNLMSRLREKIEPDPQQPRFIRTLPQSGYMVSPHGGSAENQP